MTAKVLIVDDETDLELLVRQRFRRMTRDGTYEFVFARNGQEALEAIAADPAIEVVLSDINMPVMDGLTLLARLRENSRQLGTVIVSAYGDLPNIRAAMNRGAFDFLTKPIDFQDFEVTIKKTVDQVRRLREATTDHDRLVALQQDLQTAARIQQSFLPRMPLPSTRHAQLDLHATMLPARAVGGDFYDYFLLEKMSPDSSMPRGTGATTQRMGLVIGDVSGKGVPAALFMAVSRTLLRTVGLSGAAPDECLRQVNRQLLQEASESLFVTLFYAILDMDSGDLQYCIGGHNPPYLLRAGGDLEHLTGRGFPVGTLEDASYELIRIRLHPGDQLFLYTDGIMEAMNGAGVPFSDLRLREALRRAGDVAPEVLVAAVLEEVGRFTQGAPQSDDITALALRFTGAARNRQEKGP